MILNTLPEPSADTPWEEILNFGQDPAARAALARLRKWMATIAKDSPSPGVGEDELTVLLYAHALHMANTHFDDPTGLSPDNLSTARDVVKMAEAAAHYPLISEYTTLPRYEEEIGTRTRFYHNTDPIVRAADWDVLVAKTGYIREAGRCIVVVANMPNGQVMIALLGSQTSWGRSTDLVTIRRWLNGDETPVVEPRYYASARLHHHHSMLARSHRVKVRFASYRTGSASGAHRQTVKHHAGKREHHPPVAA